MTRNSGSAAQFSRQAVVATAVIALLAVVGLAATLVLKANVDASSDLDRFVLAATDLPPGYRPAERVTPAEGCSNHLFGPAETKRLRARGVVGCSLVKYQRPGAAGNRGVLVYLSAYLFDDQRGASAALPQFRSEIVARASSPRVVGIESLPVKRLGTQAPHGLRLTYGGADSVPASVFAFLWRRDKVVASIVVADTGADFVPEAVLALARRIDARATAR